MVVALKQLAGVIFAAMFLSIAGAVYLNYVRGSAKSDFEREAQNLAERIDILAGKDEGTKEFFEINVPPGCELRFEDNSVVAVVDDQTKIHNVVVNVVGSTITDKKVTLTLERVENGVTVSG